MAKLLENFYWLFPIFGILAVAMFFLGKRFKEPLLLSGWKWMVISFFTLVIFVLGYYFAFLPLRFFPVIRAIERAATSTAESNAFFRATKIGHLWEVEYISGNSESVQNENLLKIEWLECDFRGKPYQAFRKVINTNNIAVLR